MDHRIRSNSFGPRPATRRTPSVPRRGRLPTPLAVPGSRPCAAIPSSDTAHRGSRVNGPAAGAAMATTTRRHPLITDGTSPSPLAKGCVHASFTERNGRAARGLRRPPEVTRHPRRSFAATAVTTTADGRPLPTRRHSSGNAGRPIRSRHSAGCSGSSSRLHTTGTCCHQGVASSTKRTPSVRRG
jgi:hypothetical protein